MKTGDAVGFLGLGLGMFCLPAFGLYSPSSAPSAIDALWLQFMGVVLIALGGGFLAKLAWLRVEQMLENSALRFAEAIRTHEQEEQASLSSRRRIAT